MVKNTGGNKSKKVARKNAGSNSGNSQEVRRVNDPCEMYAAVTKIYSSRRCDVTGTDGKTYQCNVRGKFLKNKRAGNNALVPGVWIIIGFYDWEVRGDGSKTCDLLEIYSPIEKDKLKQLEAHNLAAIMNIGELEGTENEFTFSKFKDIDSSSEEEEEAIEEEKKVVVAEVVVVEPVVIKKKETLEDQMDWLSISERDI
jgi:hypothetical protein